MQMASAHQVLIVYSIYCQSPESHKMILCQWNLNSDAKIQIELLSYDPIIKVFNLTHLCSVCSSYYKNKIKVYYYILPLKSNQDKPLSISQKSLNGSDLTCLKLNQCSMVGWISEKPSQQYLSVVTHCLVQNSIPEYKTYTFPIKLRFIDKYISILIERLTYISDIWQINPGYFYVQLCHQTGKTKNFDSYIWQYKTNSCRKLAMQIQQEHQLQFLSQLRQPQKFKSNIIYYIDLFSQQILAIDSTGARHSHYQQSYYYPHYTPGIQFCFKDDSQRWRTRLQVCKRKIQWEGIIYSLQLTFLLDSLFQEFDQDLVQYTIKLISQGS